MMDLDYIEKLSAQLESHQFFAMQIKVKTLTGKESTRFLQLFEKVKVEFLDEKGGTSSLYMPSVWQKNKSTAGSAFDCINMARDFPDQEGAAFKVLISLWLDQTPKRFGVSKRLQEILGVQEETRSKVVAALW